MQRSMDPLGQHIADLALDGQHVDERSGEKTRSASPAQEMAFDDLEKWFERLWQERKVAQPSSQAHVR